MNRSDLIIALASQFHGITEKDAEIAVKVILDAIGQALAKGDRVEIRDFGSFALNYRKPRTGRNPRTGKVVSIAAKATPHFKAGKEMRERVEQSVRLEKCSVAV